MFQTTIVNNGSKVERLPFYNHTECGCVEKSSDGSSVETLLSTVSESSRIARSGTRSIPETIRK